MNGNRRQTTFYSVLTALTIVALLHASQTLAGPDPVPITADQAFDAVMTGTDPVSGIAHGLGKVAIVDVRTPPEFQFQGTAAKVDSLRVIGQTAAVIPDHGKVKYVQAGAFLTYSVSGDKQTVAMEKVSELITSPIAVNIPCADWNPSTSQMDPVPEKFVAGLTELADKGVEIVITMCNSGGRSTACVVKFVDEALASRFKAFYEIDRPGEIYLHPEHKVHLAGLGGFQGSAYAGIYNGLAGYPSRNTAIHVSRGWDKAPPTGPSVSWKDSGLPVYIPETSCNLPGMPPTR